MPLVIPPMLFPEMTNLQRMLSHKQKKKNHQICLVQNDINSLVVKECTENNQIITINTKYARKIYYFCVKVAHWNSDIRLSVCVCLSLQSQYLSKWTVSKSDYIVVHIYSDKRRRRSFSMNKPRYICTHFLERAKINIMHAEVYMDSRGGRIVESVALSQRAFSRHIRTIYVWDAGPAFRWLLAIGSL